MRSRVFIFFVGIALIAGLFRFTSIGTNPPSLTWDEVAWGYNAYSIGIDGRDEFGRFLPHDYLESFGDFKPPVYAYLDVLPIKLFGLNAFATRLPSATFGFLTVLVTFFLTRALFLKHKQRDILALLAMGVLAISPWHIMLSRAAWEANVASFFIATGVWLFLEGVQRNKYLFFVSITSFILSIYTFNSTRVSAPLLMGVLTLFFWKTIQHKKVFVCSLLFGILLLLPTLSFLRTPQASLRFKEVNIFSDVSVIKTVNQEMANDHNSLLTKVIHNRRLVFSVLYLQHYFDHFSPTYLFITGDGNPKFSVQDVGQLYMWDIPFLIIGVIFLFRKREGRWWLIPLWLLIGIIPAATARETPHALRTESMLPTVQILVAYGIFIVGTWWITLTQKKPVSRLVGFVIVTVCLSLNVFYFGYKLFVQYPRIASDSWQYGYTDSIAYAKSVADQYDAIMVSDVLGRPYIYYVFYLPVTPSEYRKTSDITRDSFSFVHVNRVGKYVFTSSALPQGASKILYIDSMTNVPKTAHVVKTFYLKDNQPVLEAYTL